MVAQPLAVRPEEGTEQARRWSAYIAGMEAIYEEVALTQGAPYIRHAPDELEEIAALVADYGIDPETSIPMEPVDEREFVLAGAG